MSSAPPAACSDIGPVGLQMSSQIEIADAHAADQVQLQRLAPGGEVPLLVEDGIVRQEALPVDALDLTLGADGGGVVEVEARVGEPDDGGAAARPAGDLAQHLEVVLDEAGLEEEVLRRIAGDGELGEEGDVRTSFLGLLEGGEDAGGVARRGRRPWC